MPLIHIILVALIQGVTEFLPVSSSGHLILLPLLTGLEDQGQFIDVAVHVGTLGAVVLYFRRDVAVAVTGLPALLRGDISTPGARLALGLIIATIPAIIFGFMLKTFDLSDQMRNIKVIGWTMLGFGMVLWLADRTGRTSRRSKDWGLRDALIMGLWQAIALIPGTSRSGITITGARWLGYNRPDAARLSMLMSIPIIIASGTLLGIEVIPQATPEIIRDGALAAGLAFVSALLALALMMRLLRTTSFTPYVVYRVALGGVLLWIAYAP